MIATRRPLSSTARDNNDQARLIIRHRRRLARQLGHEVDEESAALDWVSKFASHWRLWREARRQDPASVPTEFRETLILRV